MRDVPCEVSDGRIYREHPGLAIPSVQGRGGAEFRLGHFVKWRGVDGGPCVGQINSFAYRQPANVLQGLCLLAMCGVV